MTKTTQVDDDVMQCGYIKAKFTLKLGKRLDETECYKWCASVARPRVTDNFVYVSFGHKDLVDNDTAREYLRIVRRLGGKITRLDFCIDYLGVLDYDAFYYLHDNGQRPTPTILKSPGGTTVYVGKRSSARMLRVYDKTAEILAKEDVDIGFDITRIELEVKRGMIPRYRCLFLTGRTDAILADVQYRYGLQVFCRSAMPIKPTHNRDKEVSLWNFIHRYRRIIKDAYIIDKSEFLRILEVTDANST